MIVVLIVAFSVVVAALILRIDDLEARLKATEIQVRSLSSHSTNGFTSRGF